MICPGCEKTCNVNLQNKYYCRFCGAVEKANTSGPGNMWVRDGRIIAIRE